LTPLRNASSAVAIPGPLVLPFAVSFFTSTSVRVDRLSPLSHRAAYPRLRLRVVHCLVGVCLDVAVWRLLFCLVWTSLSSPFFARTRNWSVVAQEVSFSFFTPLTLMRCYPSSPHLCRQTPLLTAALLLIPAECGLREFLRYRPTRKVTSSQLLLATFWAISLFPYLVLFRYVSAPPL